MRKKTNTNLAKTSLALLLSVVTATTPVLNAQQTGENKKPNQEPAVFTGGTTLVVEDVSVFDKAGKVIKGLTKKDFTVTEDGAPQEVKYLDFIELPDVLNTTPLPPANTA